MLDIGVIWDLRQAGALADTHPEASDTTFTVVVRSAGQAVAIIPAASGTNGSRGCSTLSPLSELVNTHSDFSRSEDRQGIIAAFFSAVVQANHF